MGKIENYHARQQAKRSGQHVERDPLAGGMAIWRHVGTVDVSHRKSVAERDAEKKAKRHARKEAELLRRAMKGLENNPNFGVF